MDSNTAKQNNLTCMHCNNGILYQSLFDLGRHQNHCNDYAEQYDDIDFDEIEEALNEDDDNLELQTNQFECNYCKNGKRYSSLTQHYRHCKAYQDQFQFDAIEDVEGNDCATNEVRRLNDLLNSDDAIVHNINYTPAASLFTGFTHHAPEEEANYTLLARPPLHAHSKRIAMEIPPEEQADNDRYEFELHETEVHEFDADYDSDDYDTLPGDEDYLQEDQNSHFPTNSGSSIDADTNQLKSPQQDKYHPDNFDDTKIEYFEPSKIGLVNNPLPIHVNAQLDLMVMLKKASAPLYLFDSIFEWIQMYCNESPGIFEQNEFRSREQLIKDMAKRFETNKRKPKQTNVKIPRDGRIISIPKFDFIYEVLSILHDPDIMRPENFVEGYDVYTGRSIDGTDFWVDDSIDEDAMFSTPTPRSQNKVIHHLYCGTKFQRARDRFCNREYHMPIPLILFYDEANVDFFGGLKSAPIMFSLGLFKNACRARLRFWRTLAVVPNLSAGKGKSDTTSAEDKARDHHLILREAMSELERICNQGGIRTRVNGRKGTLKFWIHFVIGDTKGHNDLCGSVNSSKANICMRDCLCPRHTLSKIPQKCTAKTLEMVRKGKSEQEEGTLEDIGQRNLDNVFDHLPMGHPTRGIHACTLYEGLHVFGQGLHGYLAEATGMFMHASKTNKEHKGSKIKRNEFDKLFRVMSRKLERQSERDFPRRSGRSSFTDNSRLTATEKRGNALCLLVLLHTSEAWWLLTPFLEQRGISLITLRTALLGVIAYESWLLQPNPAHEVLQAKTIINIVMKALRDSFVRGESSDGWDIPKFHASVRMHEQVISDGPGEGYDSRHGENFHKDVAKGTAKKTQLRQSNMHMQMGDRLFEDITANVAVAASQDDLLMLKKSSKLEDDIKTSSLNHPPSSERSYYRGDYKVDSSCEVFGQFHQRVPSSSDMICRQGFETRIKWANKYKNRSQAGAFKNLIYALSKSASDDGWKDEFLITGYTSIKKFDHVQKKSVRYRCDPQFRGNIWRDWGNFRFATKKFDSMSPGMILGFVTFATPGFPTPFLIDKFGDLANIPKNITDSRCYIVVWPTKDTINIEENFITRASLDNSHTSIYVLPMESLIGPVCAVPNIHIKYRYKQDLDSWLIVKPKRMWGDEFSSWIKNEECNVDTITPEENQRKRRTKKRGREKSVAFPDHVEGNDEAEDMVDDDEESTGRTTAADLLLESHMSGGESHEEDSEEEDSNEEVSDE